MYGDSYQLSASGGSGDALTSGTLAQFAATTSLELKGVISDETGSGALVFATSPTLVTPALGTPSSGNLASCTGLPISTGVSGLGTGIATMLGYAATKMVAQVVVATQTGKVATTTLLPSDDTIAQNTEGAELMTITVTPKAATSTLLISIAGFFVFDSIGTISHAVFVDTTADCIWQGVGPTTPTGGYITPYAATFSVAAGSTSARTYKWRFGSNNAGTVTAHGLGAPNADDLGGKMQHTMTVTEVLA